MFFLADSCFFTNQFSEIEQFRPSNFTSFQNLYLSNMWRVQGKNSLNTDTGRHLSNSKGFIYTVPVKLYNISPKILNTLFIALNNTITNYNIIAGLELWPVLFLGNLLVYVLYRVHYLDFLGRKDTSFSLFENNSGFFYQTNDLDRGRPHEIQKNNYLTRVANSLMTLDSPFGRSNSTIQTYTPC